VVSGEGSDGVSNTIGLRLSLWHVSPLYVKRETEVVDCGTCPGTLCHVKDVMVVFNRMGDMGNLPTSAWLQLWKGGGLRKVLADVRHEEASPPRLVQQALYAFCSRSNRLANQDPCAGRAFPCTGCSGELYPFGSGGTLP
jgi:hypothetical protein